MWKYKHVKALFVALQKAIIVLLKSKGNMNIEALEVLLQDRAESVPLVMLTLTNNTGGGQPVSLENIRNVRAICREFSKPLYLDGCRYVVMSHSFAIST